MEIFNSRSHIIKRLTDSFYSSSQLEIRNKKAKIIVFSDHHRGDRGVSDYFQRSEKVYNAALGYYLERGFTLILAGDVEEFWECHPKKVINSYPFTYELEKKFHQMNRFIKISGNHDNLWKNKLFVKRYAGKIFPGINIREGIRLNLRNDDGNKFATVFITHGHQGTFLSDTLDWFGRFWLRNLQKGIVRLLKQKYQTPATKYSLREKHEQTMFEWSDTISNKLNERILFLAGHTHHPIFMPHNTLNRLQNNISALKAMDSKRNRKLAARMNAQLEYLKTDMGYEFHQKKTNSCYFNTGCCSFHDGSITGIEISKGKIKLIKWMDSHNHAERVTLGTERIRDL